VADLRSIASEARLARHSDANDNQDENGAPATRFPQGADAVWRSERLGAASEFFLTRRISRMPGRHITDYQTTLYMKSRQTNSPAIAAAKAGFSTATAYRISACARETEAPAVWDRGPAFTRLETLRYRPASRQTSGPTL
jgi:hypothetical protein